MATNARAATTAASHDKRNKFAESVAMGRAEAVGIKVLLTD